ncbi:MAG: M16 family metallopeptidase [Bosea sp. (in: a-proteobacteria)]|uniref:M16 family metallopeptidase n=1 Tax=unclassified Bosea (in: a-proteobacteria) TaxID=2653178 RepID=UPI000959DA32|nr:MULTISPECIES: pitrilysin family protein [unclassified Bosea (in: a-proteobacteria)]OJV06642.1 MAG: peptidase M16 [Bosea sp. 67-29]
MNNHARQPGLAEPVESFRLGNGLDVVVVSDRRAPVVTHMVWYRNGSADDPAGKSGIAHFLEHLMFKGTQRWPAGEFSKIVAGFGGQENAFTSYDYTAYFQRVPKEHLRAMMDYEADRMTGLSFDESVVGPERDVVLEERRMRVDSDPAAQLGEEFSASLFFHHPYGTPIIGWEHEIERLNRDDAFAYYQRFYTPENAILVVAGDTDAAEVRSLAEDTYGRIAARGAAPVRERPIEPDPRASRRVQLNDPRVQQPSLRRGWLTPTYTSGTAEEVFALELVAEILGGGTTSRLYRRLCAEDELAAGASAYFMGSMVDRAAFQLSVSPRPGVAMATLESGLDAALAAFLADGPSELELARARTRLVAETVFARDNQASLARIFGSALAVGETVADVLAWPQRIEAVPREAVVEAARRYLRPDRSVTGLLLPA